MDLATAISQMEGWNIAGSVANRNNNPGNLRYASNQIGQENTVNGKFATFATAEDGWQALQDYIDAHSGMTLRNFIYKYAPPNENNTSEYLNYLSEQLGIGVDSQIESLYDGTVDTISSVSGNVSNILSGDTWGIDNFTLVGVGVAAVVLLIVAKG